MFNIFLEDFLVIFCTKMLCSLIVYHDRVLLVCGIEMLCSLIACYDSMWVICCTAAAPTTGHSMKTWKSSQPLKWAQLRLLTYDFKVLLPTWQAVNVQPGFTESLLSSFFFIYFFLITWFLSLCTLPLYETYILLMYVQGSFVCRLIWGYLCLLISSALILLDFWRNITEKPWR